MVLIDTDRFEDRVKGFFSWVGTTSVGAAQLKKKLETASYVQEEGG